MQSIQPSSQSIRPNNANLEAALQDKSHMDYQLPSAPPDSVPPPSITQSVSGQHTASMPAKSSSDSNQQDYQQDYQLPSAAAPESVPPPAMGNTDNNASGKHQRHRYDLLYGNEQNQLSRDKQLLGSGDHDKRMHSHMKKIDRSNEPRKQMLDTEKGSSELNRGHEKGELEQKMQHDSSQHRMELIKQHREAGLIPPLDRQNSIHSEIHDPRAVAAKQLATGTSRRSNSMESGEDSA